MTNVQFPSWPYPSSEQKLGTVRATHFERTDQILIGYFKSPKGENYRTAAPLLRPLKVGLGAGDGLLGK